MFQVCDLECCLVGVCLLYRDVCPLLPPCWLAASVFRCPAETRVALVFPPRELRLDPPVSIAERFVLDGGGRSWPVVLLAPLVAAAVARLPLVGRVE
jgi:hypothetical protein